MATLNTDLYFPEPIYTSKPKLPDFESFTLLLEKIWSSQQVTNSGPNLVEYEKKAATFLKVPYAKAFVNGHYALESAIKALDLHGEIITTAFTFPSTTHAIVNNGLQPIFCDLQPGSYNINADAVESLITSKTSAILAVHVFGIPCDVEKLEFIAKKYNLKLIFDAAHAFGVETDHESIGMAGDLSVFSTHATKVFHTIEGGLITFKDPRFITRLSQLRNFGYCEQSSDNDVKVIGSNQKMSELHAAIGLLNLKTISQQIEKRKNLFEIYAYEINKIPSLTTINTSTTKKYNYAYAPILINSSELKRSRNEIIQELNNYNIFPRKYFHPLSTDLSCYKGLPFYKQNLPIANSVSDNILCLPIYIDLDTNAIKTICKILYEFLK